MQARMWLVVLLGFGSAEFQFLLDRWVVVSTLVSSYPAVNIIIIDSS